MEPRTNIGRHNLSPFAAASLLERNSNTPPHYYKFHVPRAVDSITQERGFYNSRACSNTTSSSATSSMTMLTPRGQMENQIYRDRDDANLAAMIAAKIRTKAELKQVRLDGVAIFFNLIQYKGLIYTTKCVME